MESLVLSEIPISKTGMRIRKPAAEVFEAFVDPEITTKFWFTKSSGRLVAGGEVTWEWEMFGVSTLVKVLAVEPGQRIHIEWPDETCGTTVEWVFANLEDGTTFVNVTHSGFRGAKRCRRSFARADRGWSAVR